MTRGTRISIGLDAFLVGFTCAGFFGPIRRPGAPDTLFVQDDDEECESAYEEEEPTHQLNRLPVNDNPRPNATP
jgi:hypothetical protein